MGPYLKSRVWPIFVPTSPEAYMARTKIDTLAPEVAERDYTQKDRDKMDDGDFGDPENQAFPIKTADDVINAASRLHNAKGDQSAIKARIIRIAKRKGFALPQTWQDDDGKESPTEALVAPITQTKSKIATLRVRWLQDNAISLNKRQYPTEACNILLSSAQRTLADPNAPPLTCYVSHGTADNDDSLKLVGSPSKVWREGSDLLALIDIPNTAAGRDIVELAGNNYLKPVSLRATGAEMRMDRNRGIPQVGGSGLTLRGIDFTTNPGLPGVGMVQDVTLFESAQPVSLTEIFDFHHDTSLIIEENPMTKIEEDVIPPMASGVTQGMTDNDPQSNYAKRSLPVPPVTVAPGTPTLTQESMEATHNHAASMLNMPCAPNASESGKTLSSANTKKLGAIHDMMAEATGKTCSYESFKASGAGANMPSDDHDGDDDGAPAALVKKENASTTHKPVQEKTMTPEEMVQALKESGYAVQAPKTSEELLQERFEARIAEQQKSFEAKLEEQQKAILAAIKPQQTQETPQRRSLVEGANTGEVTTRRRNLYENGSYIQNRLQEADIETIADRSAPLPDGLNADYLLKEFGTVLFNNIMNTQYVAGLI
jgi:hypothetical protein